MKQKWTHLINEKLVHNLPNSKSIRELCKIVFDNLDLDYKKYVRQNKKFLRPEELKYLRGDSKKAKKILKWKPEISFQEMIEEITEFWLNHYKAKTK